MNGTFFKVPVLDSAFLDHDQTPAGNGQNLKGSEFSKGILAPKLPKHSG